jgi:2'-5' RNA ligase
MARLFIAIEVPGEIRKELAECQRRLARRAPGFRWTALDHMHLTLVFLGETDRAGDVRKAMDAAAASAAPMDLAVGRLGFFGRPAAPRVVWAGVQGSQALGELQRGLTAALRAAGFTVEDRPFAPHLTLGRARDGARNRLADKELDAAAFAAGPTFRIGEIVLFDSAPGPAGRVYSAVHRSVLGAEPPTSSPPPAPPPPAP